MRAASHSACPVAPLRAGPTYLIQGFVRQLINIKLNLKQDLSGTQKAERYVLWWETGGEQPSPATELRCGLRQGLYISHTLRFLSSGMRVTICT